MEKKCQKITIVLYLEDLMGNGKIKEQGRPDQPVFMLHKKML